MVGLALVTGTARTVTQFRSQRRLYLDDFILILACLTLIASQILLYVFTIDAMFRQESIFPYPTNLPKLLASVSNSPEVVYRQKLKFQKILFACLALTWTSIFAVKICFLLFFYPIIKRLQRFMLAWKVMFGIIICIWVFCTFQGAISCPNFSLRASKSALPSPAQSCSL